MFRRQLANGIIVGGLGRAILVKDTFPVVAIDIGAACDEHRFDLVARIHDGLQQIARAYHVRTIDGGGVFVRNEGNAGKMDDAIRAKVSAEEASRREVELQARSHSAAQPAASAASSPRAHAVDAARPVKTPPAPSPRSEPRSAKRPAVADAQRVSDYQARQQAAQAHRDDVERRNAARAASGKKPAAPLPIPPVMPVAP